MDPYFETYWQEIGQEIARGERVFCLSDLQAIAHNLSIHRLRPEYLPDENTVLGTAVKRKTEIFRLAHALWGIEPEGWLRLENRWLHSARDRSGSEKTGGKDDLNDVVSAEILIRFIATANLVNLAYHAQFGEDSDIYGLGIVVDESIKALTLTVATAAAKGRTRLITLQDSTLAPGRKTVYGILRYHGLMLGTGGGKYLPDPETTLPELLLLLDEEKLQRSAYL